MRFAIIQFPGSNCDFDSYHVIKNVYRQPVDFIFHKEKKLNNYDIIILPGGFSYGDYLRTGAIARFSPIMEEVIKFAREGRGLVLGICNGFQILVEAGLLPGALHTNINRQFICKYVNIRVETPKTPFTQTAKKGQVLRIPIAHGDGNYFADKDTLKRLEDNGQIVFKYCDEKGEINDEANPNGSISNIAGICNKKRNVLGMMPHPERSSEEILGSEDGKVIFQSLLAGI